MSIMFLLMSENSASIPLPPLVLITSWGVCVFLQVNWQQERFQEIVSKLGHFLKQAGFKVMQSVHMQDIYVFPLCLLYSGNFPPIVLCYFHLSA